jgi:hypothetical protein
MRIAEVLQGMALLSLPSMGIIWMYDRWSRTRILREYSWQQSLNFLAITGIVIGVLWMIVALNGIASNSAIPIRNYAYEIFLILSGFVAIPIALLMASFPVKLLINPFTNKVSLWMISDKEIKVSRKTRLVCLSLVMLLAISIIIIPHMPTLNPTDSQVGTDSNQYVNWINALNESDTVSELLYQAFVEQNTGERPLTLIFLYVVQNLSSSEPLRATEYSLMILGPALTFAIFFLTRELTRNDVISLAAALLTAVSFQMTIAIYAGFYANLMALVFGYSATGFLLRYLRSRSKANLILYGTFIMMTLFAHVYSWSVLTIVVGSFLLFLLISPHRYYPNSSRRIIITLLLVLLGTVAVDIARTQLTASSGGIERDLQFAQSLTGVDQFFFRWNNLTYTTTAYLGGQFANFIIFGLAVYWLLRTNSKQPSTILLMIFLSVALLAFLFGNYVVQARILYNIPFQIPAAIALLQLNRESYSQRLRTIPLLLWIIAITITSVSNFYLVLPG